MAAAAILNLLPVAIFDIQPTFHFWAQPPHKIWCQYLNRRLTYGNFSKFKMAAVHNLGFSKIWFLTNRWHWAAHLPPRIVSEMTCNVSMGTLNPTIPLEQFADYHRVGSSWAADFPSRYHIWCKNFWLMHKIMAQKRNSSWRPPPSWIYFLSLFLTYSRLSTFELNHHTKFRANGRPPSWIVQNLISDQWVSLGYWFSITVQNLVQKYW